MERNGQLFGQLFTKHRLKAEFSTLAEFGRALAAEGLLYEDSIFSRWQKGNRLPKERKVLLTILKVFIKRNGVQSTAEANFLLQSAKQEQLTITEEKLLFTVVPTSRLSAGSEEYFNLMLSIIINSNEKLTNIESQVNLMYEVIYEGYPSIVYDRLNKLTELIRMLKLDANQEGKNLVSKINWVRIKCLCEMTGNIHEYNKTLQEAQHAIVYADENQTINSGQLHWLHASLERKKTITENKAKISQSTLRRSLSEAQLGVSLIPENEAIRISALLEVVYFSLALKDKALYERTLFEIFSLTEKFPSDLYIQFMKAFAWDAKARGDIRFGLQVDAALDNLKIAKTYSQEKYQTVNVNLQGTEFQALELSPDQEHHKYAEKLREILLMESMIVNNPYQKMRFERKNLLGL